jgi:DNA-binding MarR family transcriptional regulator
MTNGQSSPSYSAAQPLLYLREDELDRGVALMLSASRALWRAAEPALAEQGLGAADYRAMAVIARLPGVAVMDLAGHLGVAKQSATRTLDLLEERGLIARRICASDKRRRLLDLTPAGASAFASATEAMRVRIAQAYRAVGPHVVASARELLQALERAGR